MRENVRTGRILPECGSAGETTGRSLPCAPAGARGETEKTACRPLRLYNIIFPVYLLLYFPNPLWLAAVPLNYAADAAVLNLGLRREAGFQEKTARSRFIRRHGWKICLAGFASDFAGSLLLILRRQILGFLPGSVLIKIQQAVYTSPFSSAEGLAAFLAAILLAGLCIFALDFRILNRSGLEHGSAGRLAGLLAAATAPYLMLLPTGLFYR